MLIDERISELRLELITHSQSNSDAKRRHLDAFARAIEREARREVLEEMRAACMDINADAFDASKMPDATDYVAGYQDASLACADECYAAIRALIPLIDKEPRT